MFSTNTQTGKVLYPLRSQCQLKKPFKDCPPGKWTLFLLKSQQKFGYQWPDLKLLRHERGHTGIKRFQCDVCQSRFSEKKSLTIHLRTHTGERPYACGICAKRFSQSGTLATHMATHSQYKSFFCTLCNPHKSFRQKAQLKLHMQRHDGIRLFECR